MTEVLNLYFHSLLHPFKVQEFFRKDRELKQLAKEERIFTVVEDEPLKVTGLTFIESMSVSWLFYFFKSFYDILAIYIGWNAFTTLNPVESEYLASINLATNKIVLFGIIFKVILFPLGLWLYSKFWVNIIKLFSVLFEKDKDNEKIAVEIVNQSLSTHAYLVVPFFGELIQLLANMVYLYAGLRRNLELNRVQSLLVIISPLILFLLILFLLGMNIFFLIMSFM